METYKIDAVDSILKRVIKSNLTKEELKEFYSMLIKNGYEPNNIIIERE